MIFENRKSKILNLLSENEVLKTSFLQDRLKLSQATLRRDLIKLEEENLIKRVFGGIMKINVNAEPSTNQKQFDNLIAKRKIANLALSKINDLDVIFIDGGTTNKFLFEKINQSSLQITLITNSVENIKLITNNNIKAYLIGGRYKTRTNVIIGSFAITQINNFSFDKVFIGANAINDENEIFTPDIEEALIKESLLKRTNKAFVLIDKSKFNSTSKVKINYDKIEIISNEN